ncbi:hypothetical protein PIB30_063148 [Stylosanthes scabra]|uniref:Uncharacterized protein n=1 Tax=Stylosanthes scabra TaxID=79078 RepID=A0ABU6UKV2_9FABA|nr:hypothetical protein [Stylosanthes scabra]
MRSADLGRLTREVHVVGAADFETPRMLELRRGSVCMEPRAAIIPYIQEAGFEGPLRMRDFDVDGPLLWGPCWRMRPRFPAVVWSADVGYGRGVAGSQAAFERRREE